MIYKKKFKKIIIHIGFDKTGSSAIQKNLHSNRDVLMQHNIYYAPGKFNVALPSFCSTNPKSFVYNCLQRPNLSNFEIHQEDRVYLKKFIKNLHKIKSDYFVISYEGIAYLDIEAKIKLKKYLLKYTNKIEIIGYVRNHIDYAKSAISERVKQGFSSWSMMQLPICPYKKILEEFINIFEIKNMHIKLFSKDKLLNGDIVDDFLKSLSMASLQKKIILINKIDTKVNKSISMDAVFIGDKIRLFTLETIQRGGSYYKRVGCLLEKIDGDTIYLSNKKILLLNFFAKKNIIYLKDVFGIDSSSNNPINKTVFFNIDNYNKSLIDLRVKNFIVDNNIVINKINLWKRFSVMILDFRNFSFLYYVKISSVVFFIFLLSIFFKLKYLLR